MNHSPLRHLPNLLTCLNLLSGCMALVFVFKGNVPVFSLLIGFSLICDFLDGFAARRLKAYSEIGKQLDSLADMVTFGVVPGAIMYHLFLNSTPINLYTIYSWVRLVAFFPFLITVFSALRLAKFNVDTRQLDSFIGLPTPAITIFITGIALVIEYDKFHLTPVILNSYFIAGLSMIISYSLVSDIPLFALKFKSFSFSQNRIQFLFLFLCILLFLVFQFAAIPLSILLYLILSIINNSSIKKI